MSSKVSSHFALGVAPLHAQLATVLCRVQAPCPATRVSPSFAMVSSGNMPGCPQGARALPHNRPTVRPSMANCRAGLNKALKFAPHTAPQTTTNQHNQATKQSTRATHKCSVRKALSLQRYPTTASSQTLNTYTTASSELLSTTAAIKNHTGYVQWCSVHHAASTGIGKLTYVRWQTPQARTSRHNSDTVKHSHLQACPRRSPHRALGLAPLHAQLAAVLRRV